MKKFLFLILLIVPLIKNNSSMGQIIPFGDSQDTIYTTDGLSHVMYYYKPPNYDSLASSILFGIHGTGGNGEGPRSALKGISYRRKALIVAPTFPDGAFTVMMTQGWNKDWLVYVFKEMYRHVLFREKRDTINAYLIGHSGGGQFVTRYMLFRNAIADSIPLMGAVSCNAYYYTFCTDSFKNIKFDYPCGLASSDVQFINNQHILNYYNSDYALLNGTADTIDTPNGCAAVQGKNRYERGKNFYLFSQSDAIKRGTLLNWQYWEAIGIGHNDIIYEYKENQTDTFSVAESLLFDKISQNIQNDFMKNYNEVKIWPNPLNEKLLIQVTGNEKNIIKIELMDFWGRNIRQKYGNFNNSIILDRDNLPSGMYFLRISTIKKVFQIVKIIIQ